MQSPTPHTRFEIAVEEGYQVTRNEITRIKLLISITDASRQWVGRYAFLEELPDSSDRPESLDRDQDRLIAIPGLAESTIQFGTGTVEPAAVVRRARTVDGFVNQGRTGERTARIHDARFAPRAKRDASGAQRLDIAIGFDLFAGRERESVRANVGVLSLRPPRGNIHPALGYLVFLRRERCAKAKPAESRELVAAGAW